MLQNAILFPKAPLAILNIDDIDIGLKVKYVGTAVSSTVTVSVSGDITFKQGAVGAEAVDATIDSGGDDPGVIDVSNPSANTFGEVVDMINASPNWEAYLVGTLRADLTDASVGSLLTRSETTLAPKTDLSLFKDTSKVLNISVRAGVRTGVNGSEEKGATELYSITSTNTFGSGTNLIQIYEIDEAKNSETKIYELAGGATTVENTKSFVSNGRGSLGVSKQGNHLLVRMIGSVDCTGSLQVIGAVAKGL